MLLLLEKKLVRSKEVLQKIDIVSLFGCQFAAILFAWTSVSKESPFKIQVAPCSRERMSSKLSPPTLSLLLHDFLRPVM